MGDAKVLNFLIFGGLALLIYLGIVVFAIMAARRHKLTGLWVLAAAAAIAFVQAVVNILLSSPWRSESIMRYVNLMSYLSYATIITAFIDHRFHWLVHFSFQPEEMKSVFAWRQMSSWARFGHTVLSRKVARKIQISSGTPYSLPDNCHLQGESKSVPSVAIFRRLRDEFKTTRVKSQVVCLRLCYARHHPTVGCSLVRQRADI